MKTILYCRVSTSDQTLDHQVTHARAAGFAIDEVVSDNGVSGVSTRLAERDQGKRLFDLLRRGDVLVVRWIDRLGRNYADVTEVVREFIKTRDDAYRGRKPSFTRKQLDQVGDMLMTGTSISTIAKTTGLSRQAIYRLKDMACSIPARCASLVASACAY
jgi:DNA invertase Pin-like site-specific DNA recombinase